jgi:hypothetical protein
VSIDAARRKQIGDYMEGKVMKRLTMLGLVLMFTLGGAVASANAQLSNPVRARIPFDFNVGDRSLPAGEYVFGRLSGVPDSSIISVSSADASNHLFQLTIETRVLTPKDESTLVFHKYGEQYFLEQIWSGGEQEGTKVPESRAERTIRRQLAQTQQSNVSGRMMKVETVNIVASVL